MSGFGIAAIVAIIIAIIAVILGWFIQSPGWMYFFGAVALIAIVVFIICFVGWLHDRSDDYVMHRSL